MVGPEVFRYESVQPSVENRYSSYLDSSNVLSVQALSTLQMLIYLF